MQKGKSRLPFNPSMMLQKAHNINILFVTDFGKFLMSIFINTDAVSCKGIGYIVQ